MMHPLPAMRAERVPLSSRLRAVIQHLCIKPLRTKLQEAVGTGGRPQNLASERRAAIFKTLAYNISVARKELQFCLIVQ